MESIVTSSDLSGRYDIAIIGGGSAGVCAALAAASSNPEASVLLIEKESALGGTSAVSGVDCWEPGIATGAFHAEMAGRLLMTGKGSVIKSVKKADNGCPVAFAEVCTDPYETSCRRAGLLPARWRAFHFEPAALSSVMAGMLAEHPNIRVSLNTELRELETVVKNGRRGIGRITLKAGGNEKELSAACYIDSTGDLAAARKAGCGVFLGRESKAVYGESFAPDKADQILNAVTLMFRIGRKANAGADPVPEPYKRMDVSEWAERNFSVNRPVSVANAYPNGDYAINMLPTMEGLEYFNLPAREAYEICKARVYHYFRWLQEEKNMEQYSIVSISPKIGVRESYRLAARHVLTENEVRMAFGAQPLAEEIIAYADHTLDIHGAGHIDNGKKFVIFPFGIPYSCLLPKEIDNLIVASHSAGFSHISAAAVRLARSVMALGEAAGTAAALCVQSRRGPGGLDRALLRKALGMDETVKRIREEYTFEGWNGITRHEQDCLWRE
jgi:hypothetical protein